MKEIIDVQYLVAKSKNIQSIHQIPPNLIPIDLGNSHLSIILHNLISNAINYTDTGKDIKIHYEETEKCVLFKIRDDGDGVSENRIR